MNWLDKLIPPKIKIDGSKKGVPQGIWKKCDTCQETLYKPELERNLYVCTHCGHHSRLAARIRLESFFDHKTFTELGKDIKPVDMLKFKDSKRYKDRISDAQKGTKENDAMIIAYGELKGLPVTVAAFNFEFMGGSMGSVVGEKFLRAVLHSIENKTPFICFSSSGGARMQEGLFSLMQMAKTSAALAELDEHHLPYVSVLTDPTMGGVSASLALLGDIIVAEPNALIGFAGPRVIEQTVREKLPEGFQRAEFLLEHGAIDLIISRLEMRDRLFNVLSMLMASKSVPVSEDDAVADETLEEPTESV